MITDINKVVSEAGFIRVCVIADGSKVNGKVFQLMGDGKQVSCTDYQQPQTREAVL